MPIPKKCPGCKSTKLSIVARGNVVVIKCRKCGFENRNTKPE
ncbi:MAG TPA: hypothetical protein HA254_03415 [Candidatus Diapherotrites archaeon]|uniref:Uncharacterized protein n=1 Tax=Candidatus Iainarchaeum sp. TaxID=3101447 RepID=A0A7J4J0W0_9ARCH|nr:hypothetical protein [Candidatus Diapherotrites archaeon]